MHAWILARATHGWIVRMPVYYVTLALLGLLILVSPLLTLFEYNREEAVVREMGMASLTLWGFLAALLVSGPIITQELEDRTALTLLTKPIGRGGFLMGKYLGILLALAQGVLLLGLLLLLTYWWNFGLEGMESFAFRGELIEGRMTVGDYLWKFFAGDALLLAQGVLLSGFQVALLAGAVTVLAALFPLPVSSSASVFVYLLSNMTGYLRQASAHADPSSSHDLLEWGGRLMYYLFPNLGYLNLQHAFAEGSPVRGAYLLLALIYTGLYLGFLMTAACALFAHREIR